jgi:ornithine cyclodeaminase/alanine dehydrogenase-like protein (mu-crystallin family)
MVGGSWLADALPSPKPETLLFLRRSEVVDCLARCDPVDVVRSALLTHAEGRTLLPSEAYLSWTNARGADSRSIGMPGAILGLDGEDVYGLKVINASVSNPDMGLERAGGLGLCFDAQTARVTAVMEVGLLSAVRTAAVSTLAVEAAGYGSAAALGVVGCGTQARMHLAMLLSRSDTVRQVTLFDHRPDAAETLSASLTTRHPATAFAVGASVAQTMAAADVTFFLTTASEGYVQPDWIVPGALLVNVSLGDLTDEVLLGFDRLYVDDLRLIAENTRRPLGRLISEGRIASTPTPGRPAITSTIGDLLSTRQAPPRPESGYVIVNPFGLGVLDVALLSAVHKQALDLGIGQRLGVY